MSEIYIKKKKQLQGRKSWRTQLRLSQQRRLNTTKDSRLDGGTTVIVTKP